MSLELRGHRGRQLWQSLVVATGGEGEAFRVDADPGEEAGGGGLGGIIEQAIGEQACLGLGSGLSLGLELLSPSLA